jgi:hypothetical protein
MISIALPLELESRLKGEALRQGLATEEYVTKLIVENLPPAQGNETIGELFAQWNAQDGTIDPDEIVKRNEEVEKFKQALNRNRVEMEGAGARRLFP